MPAQILDGRQHAERIRQEVAVEVAELTAEHGITPTLAAILVGDDPASDVYVRNKRRDCKQAGLGSKLIRLPASTTTHELLDVVASLNADPTVHGILCQLPLPKGIDATEILDAIDPLKDVDAFHPENVGRLTQGRPRFLPCTPAGIRDMLVREGIPTEGQNAVVVGRSEIVGKPMALLLMQPMPGGNATVTVCHSKTRDLAAVTREADILVVAAGRPNFITADMVKPGAVVIDVGINRVGDKLVGDVEFEPVAQIASHITPVPGGVGPLTRAILLRNTLTAARLQLS
jgi:methylenetetrahydrofolate dehydrogenase (NADP+)/methenyltetrahydrofolate cyclohydrolase